MSEFKRALQGIAARVPEAQLLIILGTDGIAIEKWNARGDASLEAVAAEYTTLLRSTMSATSDTDLGALRELAIVTDRLVALLIGITSEYFLFGALAPGAVTGRARFAMKLAALQLEREFL